MKVLIAGGGTAGHVFPAIALGERLVRAGAEVVFFGTTRGLETDLVPKAGFELVALDAAPFPRRLSLGIATASVALLRAERRCRPLVTGVDAVVGMGGYASGPAVLAAFRARAPVVLHEQNAVPGAANRLFSRRARLTALSFAEAAGWFPKGAKTRVTGNPVRERITAVCHDREALRAQARAEFRLDRGRTTLVVFGGSQGALHLDEVGARACGLLADRADLQVILLTGRAHHGATLREIREGAPLLVRVLPFLDRMELAYAAADLVVARAGASSIAEIAACGLPSLLVPYPYATANHQEVNARALERAGAASVLVDSEMTPETLVARLGSMISGGLKDMAGRAAAWGDPEAAGAVASIVMGEAAR